MSFVDKIVERFKTKKPISVMARATIENVLSAHRLDAIFDSNAQQQYESSLMFSTVADIIGEVVLQIHPNVNAAYIAQKEEIGVTVKPVFFTNKRWK